MKKLLILALATACMSFCFSTAVSALPVEVYSSSFETGWDTTGWSNTSTASDSNLGNYLGNYYLASGSTLTLNGLPAHSLLSLEFDLYLFSTWDGENLTWGPDYISLSGDVTFSETFTNHQPEGQSYPGSPDETYGAAGAYQTQVYRGLDPTGFGDEFLVSHNAGIFTVTFGGPTTQSDEWWGIDNVRVSVDANPIPEPATMLLLGSGLLGLAGLGKRRRSSAPYA
jgi:PEP-CTERM motif-containing protein